MHTEHAKNALLKIDPSFIKKRVILAVIIDINLHKRPILLDLLDKLDQGKPASEYDLNSLEKIMKEISFLAKKISNKKNNEKSSLLNLEKRYFCKISQLCSKILIKATKNNEKIF